MGNQQFRESHPYERDEMFVMFHVELVKHSVQPC